MEREEGKKEGRTPISTKAYCANSKCISKDELLKNVVHENLITLQREYITFYFID